MNVDDIIKKYVDTQQVTYQTFATKVNELLTHILSSKNIAPHSITSREKNPNKLKEKILREGKNYQNPLEDITDLAAVRVITYFPSDVDKIIPIIEKEFIIDPNKSIDERKKVDPSTFGYTSVHLIIGLSDQRIKLPEYSIFKNLKCEIQVRTILQHAWAEIEHDIVYKSNEDIPFELRRKFASLAGLLEIADREFESLRLDEIKVREQIHSSIKRDIINIPIDLESLRFYLEKYHNEKKLEPSKISNLIKFLKNHKIEMLIQLDEILTKERLIKADTECEKLNKQCHEIDRCLIRYFLVVGWYLKLQNDDIGKLAHCPAIYDRNFGLRTPMRKKLQKFPRKKTKK